MRFSLLLLLVGCSVLRDADDFQVGDAGPPDAALDSLGADGRSDGESGGCMSDDECDGRFANATARCEVATGTCVLGDCNEEHRNCDGDDDNGCEAVITAAGNCESCGSACSAPTPVCDVMGSESVCATSCEDAQTQCGVDCFDTTMSVLHCGMCDNACNLPEEAARATCSESACRFECNAGHEDCDSIPDNGCEVDTSNDPANCNGCDLVCPVNTGANVATASCEDSSCGIGTCAPGFADCDGDVDGCETDIRLAANCGGCGAVCGAPLTCQNEICDIYVKVAVARNHVCALRESGAVDCWGDNESRQIRDNQAPVEAPHRVTWQLGGTTTDFVASDVSVGSGFTCFIAQSADDGLDGTLYCQGSNSSIQGGRDTPTPNYPAQVVQIRGVGATTARFSSLSSRDLHSCAIDEAGGLWCWGYDAEDQTGPNAEMTRYAQPVPMPGGLAVTQVAVGIASTCALLENGTIHCFGGNVYGELGRGTVDASTTFGTPAPVIGLSGTEPLQGARSITAGSYEFCAIHGDDRELVCWGRNLARTIRTDAGSVPRPVVVDEAVDAEVVEVFMFHYATCWRNADGEVSCRGREIEGHFGRGPVNALRSENTRMTQLDNLRDSAGGYRGGCGFRNDELYCWGWSDLGNIPRTSVVEETPAPIIDDAGATMDELRGVVTTLEGSCGIRTIGGDAIAHCWGGGGRSTSGDGTNLSLPLPRAVPGLSNVLGIARGGFSVCAIEGAGATNELYCWGAPSNGSGAGVSASEATLAPGVVNPVSLDMGNRHGCAVLGDDTVRCWGYSPNGETSVVVAAAAPTTVMMAGSAIEASQVVTGFNFSCAILLDPAGQVVCWGDNASGQLGLGAATPTELPMESLIEDAASLEAGYLHVCAIRTGGEVVCWGSNIHDQLGVAAPMGPTNVELPGLAVSVAAGGRSSCAALADGSVYCWGDNLFSQLGSPSPSGATPQQVPGVTSATTVTNSSDLAYANCAGNETTGTWQCWGLNSSGKLGTDPDLFFAPTLIDRSTR